MESLPTEFENLVLDSVFMHGIIVVQGVEVKCDTEILSARSPVLKAMFKTSMKEGTPNTIEIKEMTVESVRALLSYLDSFELKVLSKSCSVAYDLLKAGDIFDIKNLREDAIDVLYGKDIDWYTPGVLVQLLLFLRNKLAGDEDDEFESYKNLEKMALEFLRGKPREEVKACSEFQNIFRDPKLGMSFALNILYSRS